MVLGDLDSYMQKKKRVPTYTIHKTKVKVDKRLKYKLKHHESPRGKHWQENLRHSTKQYFQQYVPRAGDRKERTNKLDLIKLKSFCMAKENGIKMKREPTIWENIFANDTSDKGLISKIYKELTGLHSRDDFYMTS